MKILQPYHLYVERTDAARNLARYYDMSVGPTLFGGAALTRRWGRIGSMGLELVCHFERENDAVCLFLDLLKEKRARGYRPFTRSIGQV